MNICHNLATIPAFYPLGQMPLNMPFGEFRRAENAE